MSMNDVVIIRAGPAGLATAIQLSRYGIEPILFEKGEIGGLLENANNIPVVFNILLKTMDEQYAGHFSRTKN